MTLDELDEVLRERHAAMHIGHGPDGRADVNLTSVSWIKNRLVTGKSVSAHAAKFSDALEMALLKYDAIWR